MADIMTDTAPHWRRKVWRLGAFLLIRRADLQPHETPYTGFSEGYLDTWLRSPLTQPVLMDILRTLEGGWGLNTLRPHTLPLVRRRFLEALRRQELVLLREEWKQPLGTSSGRQEGDPESPPQGPPPAPRQAPTRTWIEIQLVDAKDKPIAGARYRLKLPNGSIREGRLDANGSAYTADIDPGMCEVNFPEYDADVWTWA